MHIAKQILIIHLKELAEYITLVIFLRLHKQPVFRKMISSFQQNQSSAFMLPGPGVPKLERKTLSIFALLLV